MWEIFRQRIAHLDLQAKVVLILCLVIAPTFALVTFLVSQVTIPVIEEELRVVGVHASIALAEEIHDQKLLNLGKEVELDAKLRHTFFLQPNVVQLDVFRKTEQGTYELAASTEEPSGVQWPRLDKSLDIVTAERKYTEESGVGYWEIWAPIKGKKNVHGLVRCEISLQSAFSLVKAVWKVMGLAAIANIVLLIIVLSYFLRKTITNDRKLRVAEYQNVELSNQLHEAERQLLVKEKLAVMGQLTASFAHEIGTPLNAIGGHLHLLREDLKKNPSPIYTNRLEIVGDQLKKIENIVKGFLQSTAKPKSQFQLFDLNQVIEKTLSIARPRIDSMGIRIERNLDPRIGPVRAVPLDIEQVLLNLINNSLDSIQEKQSSGEKTLKVFSRGIKEDLKSVVEFGVQDNGAGIAKEDLERVLTPFYTTKAPGQGTGLGLPICSDIAKKYNGELSIESKKGSWTRVTFHLPYGTQI